MAGNGGPPIYSRWLAQPGLRLWNAPQRVGDVDGSLQAALWTWYIGQSADRAPAVCLADGVLTLRPVPGSGDLRLFIAASGALYASTTGQVGDRVVSVVDGVMSASHR